ncbi:hypothetical protein D9611_006364 [Ephemerocybe angulata]|uniref:Uncharacterized protein n=1 Tax=Ephemerocybe angulata TaxID=980116 RepID=A0A8H5C7A8_9AGAR|nr:hypothetical protein D9611_006364 [Tulosesus angulatus]
MAPCHPLRHRNTAFRSTVSMFWGWAQTDPAGIHASSAPGHGRWARRRPTNTRTHLVIDAKPNANPDAFRLQEHRVHVLGLGTWVTPARQSNANLDSGCFQEHDVRVLGLGANFNTFERQSERFQEHHVHVPGLGWRMKRSQ